MTAADIRYQILLDGKPDNDVTAAVSSIKVEESVREESRFEVTFAIDFDAGDFCLKDDARLQPCKDKLLAVVVDVEGLSNVLVHGVIIDREESIKHGGPGSSIKVMGSDRRVVMDRNHAKFRIHKGTIPDVVRGILADGKYAFDADVEDLPCDFAEAEHDKKAAQRGSDLAMVQELAGIVGAEFWIDWTLKSRPQKVVETAHFRSQPPRNEGSLLGGLGAAVISLIAPAGAPELKINALDKENNALDFQISRTTEVPRKSGNVKRVNFRKGRVDKTTTTPSQEPLGEEPCEDISGELQRSVVTAGGVSVAQAATTAALNDAAWSISATVTTSAYALCNLIRPRQVIKVSGVGGDGDGDYFVWKVTHDIDSADHKMNLELRRNAVGGS